MSHHYKHGKRFVVRTDVNVRPAWLSFVRRGHNPLNCFDDTERPALAHEFTDPARDRFRVQT